MGEIKMNSKTKIILGILIMSVILVGGWWIWNSQTIGGPKGICGPRGMGSNYDVSYCDKSCNTNSDCKFTCGCGAINKNEICHDEGIIYDCVDREVMCKEGRCITGKELLGEGVSITTDKVEYKQGEDIHLTLVNNLSESIFIPRFSEQPITERIYLSWQIGVIKYEAKVQEEWITVPPDVVAVTPIYEELKPNEKQKYVFRPFLVNYSKIPLPKNWPIGIYKIGIYYSMDKIDLTRPSQEKKLIAYSNEFTIK